MWSGRRGSNPQPTAWEAATLPLSYSRSVEEILAGQLFDVMPRKAVTLEATRAFQLCSE